MKHYLFSVEQPDGPAPSPEFLEPIVRELNAIRQQAADAGVWVFGDGLHDPSSASVVRLEDGELLVTDGPYAEGNEHVGGLTIIKAADLDAALVWARKYARATTLPIEVRPFQTEVEA